MESHKTAARELFEDWEAARGRIITEISAKLAHYAQLPWHLLGLAHHEEHKAVKAAQRCLRLWEQGGPQCSHRQSQRFLSPTFEGGLRQYVDRMAKGESIAGPEFKPLRLWLSRFQCIKLVERTVEGTHALTTRALKRAPAAGMGYLSIELRFASFWQRVSVDPGVT